MLAGHGGCRWPEGKGCIPKPLWRAPHPPREVRFPSAGIWTIVAPSCQPFLGLPLPRAAPLRTPAEQASEDEASPVTALPKLPLVASRFPLYHWTLISSLCFHLAVPMARLSSPNPVQGGLGPWKTSELKRWAGGGFEYWKGW